MQNETNLFPFQHVHSHARDFFVSHNSLYSGLMDQQGENPSCHSCVINLAHTLYSGLTNGRLSTLAPCSVLQVLKEL